MTIIDPEPYRHFKIPELQAIVSAAESDDAPVLAAALRAAMARRNMLRAFPELSEDLRAVEARREVAA